MKTKIVDFIKERTGGKIASKQTINLAVTDKTSRPAEFAVVGLVLIVILALIIAKVGVFDQFRRSMKAESEYNLVKNDCLKLEKEANRFDDVRAEYLTYTSGWMSEPDEGEAVIEADRKDVLDMVDEVFAPRGRVFSVAINSLYNKKDKSSSDVLEVMIGTDSMNTASDVLDAVRKHPLCMKADIRLAESNDEIADGSLVRSTVTVRLQSGEDDK